MSNDLWRSRAIGTLISAGAGWESSAYEDYRQRVLESDYPCFFGQRAEQLGKIFYAFVPREDPGSIVAAMSAFSDALGSERFARFSLIAFFETGQLPDHAAFAAHFWAALQRLSDSDGAACDIIRSTDDPLWEFSFRGIKMFVVGLSDTYSLRRSRHIGSGMALIFQPRILFTDPGTGKPLSMQVRRSIHGRMRAYDGFDVHPDIGIYGSPENREWKQYVLPDDNSPTPGTCPLHARRR